MLHLIELVGIFVILQHQITQQCLAVLIIKQRKSAFQSQMLAFTANDRQPQGMKGRHGEASPFLFAKQLANALLHFTRGLVGKCDGGDATRFDARVLHHPGNFPRDHTGFARSGTGQNKQRAADVVHRLALAWIESAHVTSKKLNPDRYRPIQF